MPVSNLFVGSFILEVSCRTTVGSLRKEQSKWPASPTLTFANLLSHPSLSVHQIYPNNLLCLSKNSTLGRSVSKLNCLSAITTSKSIGASRKTHFPPLPSLFSSGCTSTCSYHRCRL